jgi:hypothetical protein
MIHTKCHDCGAEGFTGVHVCPKGNRVPKPGLSVKDYVAALPDPVNHPPHYTSHPSGVECIQITEHMGFNLGNALKYIWRADLKHDAVEDLRKARWYLDREIAKRVKP